MTAGQIYWVDFTGAIVMWTSFVLLTSLIERPKLEEKKRDSSSMIGIGLQGLGYATAWAVRRPFGKPIVTMPVWLNALVATANLALAAWSVWISVSAMRTLGKQWSYQARLVEGHRLVTGGPYQIVRNPIYTGMLGMLIVTGVANSHWIGLAGGLVLFVAGTEIRVRAEEKLMREAFGEEFEAYARRVPRIVPRVI